MAREKGKISRILVGIMMLMLIVGLAGFGATNFGGQVRSVGAVGDTEIDVNRYARSLSEELRALQAESGQNIPLSQARQFGLDQIVMQRLLSSAALENESNSVGLSVGDAEVQKQLLATRDFVGIDGKFDPEAYKFTLERAGLSVAEYEDGLRAEAASTILQSAVAAGISAPSTYADVTLAFIGERRNFSWITIDEASLVAPVETPTKTQLTEYFAANGDKFIVPAAKRISYGWLSPDSVLDDIQIDDATLQAAYDDRSAEFNLPERRLVERLVFPDAETATAALDAIMAGGSFDEAVLERGLSLASVDLGDVTLADLGRAGNGVFTLTEPGIAGVLDTDLGPAIFRVNAILAARSTTFDEARETLQQELAADAARRLVSDQITVFDDLLAGGATIEELVGDSKMTIGQIDWRIGDTDGIAAYQAFAQAASAAQPGDFPAILELEDGGIFALRLDEELAEHPDSFENARDAVIANWRLDILSARIAELSTEAQAQLDVGSSLSSLGYATIVETKVDRTAFVEGPGPEFIEQIFALEDGGYTTVDLGDRVYIAKLQAILEPEFAEGQADTMRAAVNENTEQSIGQDALIAFTRALQSSAGISLNQQAINAVHAQFP